MKKLILLGALVIGLGLAAISLTSKKAYCVWCPTYTCYGSCGTGCVCSGGRCVPQ